MQAMKSKIIRKLGLLLNAVACKNIDKVRDCLKRGAPKGRKDNR